MIYKLLCVVSIFATSAYSQVLNSTASDSLEYQIPTELEPINRTINGLTDTKELMQFEKKHELKASNIIGCIMYLSLDFTQKEKLLLTNRLKEMAIKLVEKQEPIIILNTGANSWEDAKGLNAVPNKYSITYISLGNSCTDNEWERQGIRIFNRQTINSLGIESLSE